MITLEDILDAEDSDAETQAVALQKLINAGQWSLQGSMGRAMMRAIEDGLCMLGPNAARDYWGNVVPARAWVQDGTKGSRAYVVRRMGEEWAAILEAVQ